VSVSAGAAEKKCCGDSVISGFFAIKRGVSIRLLLGSFGGFFFFRGKEWLLSGFFVSTLDFCHDIAPGPEWACMVAMQQFERRATNRVHQRPQFVFSIGLRVADSSFSFEGLTVLLTSQY
jgi:hypothetical protein